MLVECALNCRCRHKQGTSRYEPGYALDMCRSILVYIHTQTQICADTNRDTCRYELRYVQTRTANVQLEIWTKYILNYVHQNVQIRMQKYVHKYVRIPVVRIHPYMFQICTEYVHVKLLMIRLPSRPQVACAKLELDCCCY